MEKRGQGAEKRGQGAEKRSQGAEKRSQGVEKRSQGAEKRNCTLEPPYSGFYFSIELGSFSSNTILSMEQQDALQIQEKKTMARQKHNSPTFWRGDLILPGAISTFSCYAYTLGCLLDRLKVVTQIMQCQRLPVNGCRILLLFGCQTGVIKGHTSH